MVWKELTASVWGKQRQVIWNSVAGLVLLAFSDFVAQELEFKGLSIHSKTESEKNEVFQLDQRRLVTAGLVGCFVGGFVYPTAYAKLDAMFPGKHFKHVVQKSLVEIFTVGIFVNSLSIFSRGMLVGRSADAVALHVVDEMPRVTANDFGVWLPYNLVAFSLIPLYLRPTTTAGMEACWQTYISHRSHDYHGHHVDKSMGELVCV